MRYEIAWQHHRVKIFIINTMLLFVLLKTRPNYAIIFLCIKGVSLKIKGNTKVSLIGEKGEQNLWPA